MFESTAAEAVDDMQRMNVADRMKNGKRPTVGGGPKADHNTEGRTKRPTGGRRRTQTGNTQTKITYARYNNMRRGRHPSPPNRTAIVTPTTQNTQEINRPNGPPAPATVTLSITHQGAGCGEFLH